MRIVGAVLLVVTVSICWLTWSGANVEEAHAGLIMSGYVAACLLVLPIEIGVFAAVILVGIFLGLSKINETKMSRVEMPLTFLDIKIALQNPGGLLSALKLDPRVLYLVYFLLACATAVGIVVVWRTIRKIRTNGVPVARTISGAAIFLLSTISLFQFSSGMNARVADSIKTEDVWSPNGVSKFSRRLGIVPFLIYFYQIDNRNPTTSFSSNITPPAPSEISAAVSLYVHPEQNKLAPNIVVLQAESTFDPNQVFNLSAPVGGSFLSAQPDTRALGRLRVNTVGAGTWITEFETITGLNSRFFGYAGYYTHAAVSPYIKKSLATYLNDRGYRTAGFYAVPGNFYNARNAYKNYGFQNFYDSLDLGYADGDWLWTDQAFMNGVIKKLGEYSDGPFYAYLVSTENHSPHPCVHFPSKQDFITTFVGTEEFERNCSLNEYLLRLRSTDQAFDAIIQYLRELQTRTGRPYVVIVYGDHQPWSFTGGYSAVRKSTSLYETVFHLVSSLPNRVTCCEQALPDTLIPSLLSAFVAASPEDVYLGINFYLYARCGPSVFQTEKQTGLFGKEDVFDATTMTSTPACAKAREQAFAVYKRDGVF